MKKKRRKKKSESLAKKENGKGYLLSEFAHKIWCWKVL